MKKKKVPFSFTAYSIAYDPKKEGFRLIEVVVKDGEVVETVHSDAAYFENAPYFTIVFRRAANCIASPTVMRAPRLYAITNGIYF